MDRRFARKSIGFASIVWGAMICLAAGSARGEIITFDPSLPPSTGGYASPRQMSVEFDGLGFSIVLHNLIIKPYANLASQTPSGADILDSYPAGVSVQASGFGAIPFGGGFGGGFGGPFAPPQTNPVDTEEFGKNGNTTGTFNTEMLNLSLSGSINDNPLLIRESPTLMSTGQTTITDLGGGQFRITSFFDVFTELSIDGGQTWMPASSVTRRTRTGARTGDRCHLSGNVRCYGFGVYLAQRASPRLNWRPLLGRLCKTPSATGTNVHLCG